MILPVSARVEQSSPQAAISLYRVEIAPIDRVGARLTLVVDIGATSVRVTELKVSSETDSPIVPLQLSELDLKSCLATAAMLIDGRVQRPPASQTRRVEQTEAQKLRSHKTSGGTRQPPEPAKGYPKKPGPTGFSGAGAPSDLGVVYWKLGSVPKVATHYDVPRHIARDWIKELREGRQRRGR